MAKVSCIIKRPGQRPVRSEVKNDLIAFQHLVDGYIEAVPAGKNLVMIVNEEGKLWNMEPNFIWHKDVIYGTAVFVGVNAEGEFVDCPDAAHDLKIDASGFDEYMKALMAAFLADDLESRTGVWHPWKQIEEAIF